MKDNSRPLTATATRLPGVTGLVAAILASTCCILPLILIFTGIAGAGAMMTMMQYEWLTLPLGTVGLALAWGIYFRQQQRCETEACGFIGRRVNQVQLGLATFVVGIALLLKIFPSWTAAILQGLI